MAYIKVFYRGDTEEERQKSFEQALKAFKRAAEREGIIKDLRKREEYISPSKKRRERHKEAVKREILRRKKFSRYY